MLKYSSKQEDSSAIDHTSTEEQRMRNDILKAYHKLDRSWNNFMNAEKDFIDIAVMEIYNDELHIDILIKKLKIFIGEEERRDQFYLTPRALPWLKETIK